MDRRVRAAARSTEQATWLRGLARGGYVASGVIHGLIGTIAIYAALRGAGEADQAGALEAIASMPLGFAALWALAMLLWALGVFHGVHGFALRIASRTRRWRRRAAEWGQAVAFIAMGAVAAAVAVGARPNPDESAQDASRGLLTLPGGSVLLVVIGAGVIVAGVCWVAMGLRRSFRERVSLPSAPAGSAVAALGVAGFVAKGATLMVVGALLGIAGVRRDADAAGGIDAAVEHLRALPFGEAAIAVMGAGFVAYGAFCLFRARYADLDGGE